MKQLISIEERAINLAQYIIDSKDTVRGAAKKFGISKSTVHKDVTLQNGRKIGQVIPESIEIKKVFLAEKNPVVKLGLVIKWNIVKSFETKILRLYFYGNFLSTFLRYKLILLVT